MEYKDYYKTLGVERDATPDAIKKQYRILARKYHPDVSTEANAEEKFKDVREAYDVLKDPQKRKAYDQLGMQWQQGNDFRTPPGWEFHGNGETAADYSKFGGFSDFFENLFGQGARSHHSRQYQQRGEDLHSKITISLEEAYRGTEKIINLQEPHVDQHGQVKLSQRSLRVKIPAGVIEGQQIRLANQGQQGMGGAPKGDIFLEIHIQEHPFFTLKNRDIYLNLPVTPWEAALGGKVTVPTLGGEVEVNIPANSQTGSKLRLKGRGMPGKTPGDQYVILTIYIPEPSNDQQRQLYQTMAKEMHFNPRANVFVTKS